MTVSNGDVPITLEQTDESSAWTFGLADGHTPNPHESFVVSRGSTLDAAPKLVHDGSNVVVTIG